ncbi:MAG: PRC-barrel domain-containing protein [Gaiellaceae bacterium]
MLRWLRSTLRGEVSTADLESRRRVGAIAYSLAEEADGITETDRGAQLFKLCAWNAFALQTIADTLIDCDAQDDPATAGYVPRSTLRYATACIEQVPRWISCARIVRDDPEARLAASLPASLPPWVFDESTTPGELHGLRTAYEALQPRVETGLQALAAAQAVDASRLGQMRRLLAEMRSSVEYAEAIMRPNLGPVDRGEVRARLLKALRNAFELGQVLVVPTLTDVVQAHSPERDGPSIAATLSWLDLDTNCLVIDCAGKRVGFVQRVRGDRATGELHGIEVGVGTGNADLFVPPSAVAAIRPGEVVLSVRGDEL